MLGLAFLFRQHDRKNIRGYQNILQLTNGERNAGEAYALRQGLEIAAQDVSERTASAPFMYFSGLIVYVTVPLLPMQFTSNAIKQ